MKSPVAERQRARLRHQVGRSTCLHDKSFQWTRIEIFCTIRITVLSGIETSSGFESAGYSAEEENCQLFSIERNGSSLCGAQDKGQCVDARNEDRSLQGAAAWKGNPRGNPEGNAQETIIDRKHGDSNQRTSKGQCSRGDSCCLKHDFEKKRGREKHMILFYFPIEKSLEG